MKNSTRNFVKIISEICEEENISLHSFSYDWIFSLCKNGVYNYIIGYQFGLNTSSIHSICCDKSAASEIMNSFNIPNIEHRFFMSPINQKYISDEGNWIHLIELLNKYGNLVCKANEGTGGKQVFRVSNQFELENAVYKIFSKSRSMAVSPYYTINNEFRTIVLDGEIKIVYSKKRPCIIGDGIHTVSSLLFEYLSQDNNELIIDKVEGYDLTKVLENGECMELSWKHNLGQGSKAMVIENHQIDKRIKDIVQKIVSKMNIRFASIDIVECNNDFKVLEINSGVMMEHFSQQDEESYNKAKSIYREAVLKMFR